MTDINRGLPFIQMDLVLWRRYSLIFMNINNLNSKYYVVSSFCRFYFKVEPVFKPLKPQIKFLVTLRIQLYILFEVTVCVPGEGMYPVDLVLDRDQRF